MMELIIRADDMGYTETANDGAMEAIQNGYVTTASVMLDMEGTEDALRKLRACAWVSLDWAVKFWGKPLLGAECVPGLVDESGYFCTDLLHRESINEEEAEKELDAEVRNCILIYGKAPFSALPTGNPVVDKVLKKICSRYEIWFDYCGKDGAVISCGDEIRAGLVFENYDAYDPMAMIRDAAACMEGIPMVTLQPAYMDEVILAQTLEGPRSSISIHRLKDVQVLCSQELDQWLRESAVRLLSLRDVRYQTKDYENHRKVSEKSGPI